MNGRRVVIVGLDGMPYGLMEALPNYSNVKVKPFWEWEGSGRSVIINVPTTFPARPMNGVHIAGFVALDLERSTYPPSLVPTLQQMD